MDLDDDFPFNLITNTPTNFEYSNVTEQAPYPDDMLDIVKNGFFEDEKGRTFSVKLENGRMAVFHVPAILKDNKGYKAPCVVFFHGLGSWAWECALKTTKWRETASVNGFYVLFAAGTDCGGILDKRNGFNVAFPKEEFAYVENIFSFLSNYGIDFDAVYYAGHSNGAIFSSHVSQKYGNKLFAALCNCMGGFGKDRKEVCIYTENLSPLPIYFITGDSDDYKDSCLYAEEYFKSKGFVTKLEIIPNCGHVYPIGKEQEIWDFFVKFKRENNPIKLINN